MDGSRWMERGFRLSLLAASTLVASLRLPVPSQALSRVSQNSAAQSGADEKQQAETDLQLGIALTRSGSFAEAIPHFLAAKGRVSDEYALEFNLALCYTGVGQFEEAIPVLSALRAGPHEGAAVENLLAQAYAGNGQAGEAFEAPQRAASFTPKDEKLYLFVADGFLKRQEPAQSLRVIEFGLLHLPESARLHYERGYLLSTLDDFDGAKPDFETARQLAPHSEIAYLAEAQENIFAGNLAAAIRASR